MNIIDENVINSQRTQLIDWNVSVKQIGFEVGRKGLKDRNEIIPLLHSLRAPPFFTRDNDFYDKKLCYTKYSIVYLKVNENQVAENVRSFLRHPEFNTFAKRQGLVIRLTSSTVHYWKINLDEEHTLDWNI